MNITKIPPTSPDKVYSIKQLSLLHPIVEMLN